jgi:type I restriction-modification system DNA methylase subunit
MGTSVQGQLFQDYLKAIKHSVAREDYTEMTLRTPLENLIKGLNREFDVTQEAKRLKKLGAPDFTAYRSDVNVGYIEAKDLGKNLDKELESEQLKKYRESIDNIILTDYRRFILIRGNQTIFDLSLFKQSDLSNEKSRISDAKMEKFLQLTDTFFGYSQPTIRSAKVLAEELAKKTKLLKDLASEQLEEDFEKAAHGASPSPLYDFFEALNELIREISIDDCADAYAQTITYGLFLAKINEKGTLDRDTAASHIPRNIKIIRKIFSNISGDSLPSNVSWIVDALIKILNASQINEILSEIDFRGKKDRDPFTFFYEDFLAFYEPEKKKRLGVYYTPRPVVSFIVKSVNRILKDEFDKPMGLAEEGLTVLDPAVGTGTFLWLVFLSTLVELKDKGLGGLIPKKIKNHILKDFYGFELLITPYIIAHLKLTTVLKNWFYDFDDEDRVQVYLTNTLEPFAMHTHMPFFRELTEESETADALKLEKPILVVLGNPPYSRYTKGSSKKSTWIAEKIQDYKKDLHERNLQPLNDEYIKFIRFAQWKVDQNDNGIVALITNNRYLEASTLRQMRKSLLNSFNRIYLLNLHGSARETREIAALDENVFDIQQGVSIGIFVKNDEMTDLRVYYAEICGSREEKYHQLDRNTTETLQWQELHPEEPYYLLVPKAFTLNKEYSTFKAVDDIFELETIGVNTHRDAFVVDFTEEELKKKLDLFRSNATDEEVRVRLGLRDTRDWSLREARKSFKRSDSSQFIVDYAYRPFDMRKLCYTSLLVEYTRERTMKNLLATRTEKELNVGLILPKIMLSSEFTAFVTDHIVDNHMLSVKDDSFHVFPLYVKSNKAPRVNSGDSALEESDEWTPNFKEEFAQYIRGRYEGNAITPEQVAGYIYAILYSPTYRETFDEFLKIDFPRVNFVEDYGLFKDIAELGLRLIELHLMKKRLQPTTTFAIQGTNLVKSIKYKDEKAYINATQFFGGVPDYAWTFYLGSYPVLQKWLRSRRGRELSSVEIEHFLQVVEVVKKTIEYMKEIDGLTHSSPT